MIVAFKAQFTLSHRYFTVEAAAGIGCL